MGFINRLYTEPGKGVDPNAPRKKGGARFVELTLRHGGRFLGANALVCAAAAPGAVFAALSLLAGARPAAAAGGALAGAMAGPWLLVLNDTLLRAMRDEAGYFWHNARRALRGGWVTAAIGGALFGAAAAAQLALLRALLQGGGSTAGYALCFLGLLALALLAVWFWPQLALLDLRLPALLKNSVLLALAFPRRGLPAALLTLLYAGVMLAFLPLTLALIPLLGVWYITLADLLFVYPALDEHFRIEQTLRERQEQP